jgi:hypothetical protein
MKKIEVSSKVFSLIMLILFCLPVIHPLGFPFKISTETEKFYDKINTLPPGSTVIVAQGNWFGTIPQVEAGLVVTLKILFESNRDLKVIIFHTHPEGVSVTKLILDKISLEMAGRKYGEDYILFGYTPSSESSIAAFAADIRKAYPNDIEGTSIDDIPLMNGINNIADVDLFIYGGGGPTPDIYFRQVYDTYKVDIIIIIYEGGQVMMLPFMGQAIKALITGSTGAAELELLTKKFGLAVTMIDITNLMIIGFLTCVIIANIPLNIIGKSKRGE